MWTNVRREEYNSSERSEGNIFCLSENEAGRKMCEWDTLRNAAALGLNIQYNLLSSLRKSHFHMLNGQIAALTKSVMIYFWFISCHILNVHYLKFFIWNLVWRVFCELCMKS